jgi:hypothetical protein
MCVCVGVCVCGWVHSTAHDATGVLSISEVGLVTSIFDASVGDRNPALTCLITGNRPVVI